MDLIHLIIKDKIYHEIKRKGLVSTISVLEDLKKTGMVETARIYESYLKEVLKERPDLH